MNSQELYDPDYINDGGNFIHKTAIVNSNVKLGKGNIIMPYAVLGHSGFIRDNKEIKGIVEIGDGNKIGCYACIMTGESGLTKIGNDNLLMNYVNIGHDCEIGDGNEIGAKTIVCGFTKIGNKNNIKVGTRIRNRLTIGNKNIIGMGSNVVKNVGNKEKIFGNPAK